MINVKHMCDISLEESWYNKRIVATITRSIYSNHSIVRSESVLTSISRRDMNDIHKIPVQMLFFVSKVITIYTQLSTIS